MCYVLLSYGLNLLCRFRTKIWREGMWGCKFCRLLLIWLTLDCMIKNFFSELKKKLYHILWNPHNTRKILKESPLLIKAPKWVVLLCCIYATSCSNGTRIARRVYVEHLDWREYTNTPSCFHRSVGVAFSLCICMGETQKFETLPWAFYWAKNFIFF